MVIGDKLGDNAQVEIVATALGWPLERKTLRFKRQYVTGKPPFKPSLYHVDLAASDPLTPPWPDLVLTVGRRPSMAAMWIKRRSGGRTKVVLVGRPRRMLKDFDLILATPQYRLPRQPNVLRLELPLMRVDPPLDRVRQRGVAGAAGGGGAAAHRRSGRRPDQAVRLRRPRDPRLRRRAPALGGRSRARCSSRPADARLPRSWRRWLPSFPPAANSFAGGRNATDNPYHALLGLADRFVVTGDSISMLVEVARTGKPLAIFSLPVQHGPWPRVRARLARTFQPAPGDGRAGPLGWLGDALYNVGLVHYSREFEALHHSLVDGGFATILGEPFRAASATPPDDVARVVGRIRALFNLR